MKVNTIYTTFQGEVNVGGIGHPAIFLRLQGCHLRCYKKTLGVLCDTPEGLEKPSDRDSVSNIVSRVCTERDRTNVNMVTLTGGDPLWNDPEELGELLDILAYKGFIISIETSGTLSWLPYKGMKNVNWVLDYKLPSSGVPLPDRVMDDEHLASLSPTDIIKFVIMDMQDFIHTINFIKNNREKTNAIFAVGSYWGKESIEPIQLFELFKGERLLDKVVFNFQVHKMAVSPNYNATIPKEL